MWSASTMPINKNLIKKHLYELHNYKVPTFCDCCNHLLVGARKQGIRCKRCLINVHEKCQEDASPCIEVIQGRHNFQHHNYKKPQNCDYCKKLLGGLLRQGLQCSECGANVHERCQESINLTCTGGESTEKTKSDTYDRNRNQEYNEQANTNTANEKTSLQQIDNKRYGYDGPCSSHDKPESPKPVSSVDNKIFHIEEQRGSKKTGEDVKDIGKKMWFQNRKYQISLAVSVLLLLVIIIVIVIISLTKQKKN